MKKLAIIAGLLLCLVGASAQPVRETYQFAIKGSDTLFVDRHYDPSRMAEGNTPLMIYMYGGGWAYGSRGGRFTYLTDIGVQVISIDYRKGLTEYGYSPAPPEKMEAAIEMALDDLTDAMVFVLKNAEAWKVDVNKIMLEGSSAGGITTLMAIYDICNDGPYSKKFPAGWMPAGYIGYAGAIINRQQDLKWAKKPCPMMFFHGSGDSTVTFNVQRSDALNVFGPTYILAQLHEMEVPNWLYCEIDGDHVLSYKPYSGYNTHEIQTFVEKFVIQGLELEMKTEEYNMVESSHLPGMKPVRSRNADAAAPANPNRPAQR
jgi:hypothetical protein